MAALAGENVLIGETVSHYRVLRQLGHGGMGVVYEAEDLKLGRRVALKFLPHETMEDPQALQRFRLEARAASACHHESICTIFEVDEAQDQPFIAMELLDGVPLSERFNGPQLSLDSVLDIAIQIADALDAAHSRGIIHRDIKPANIFITSRGRVKVLDFGLAKVSAMPQHAAAGAATVDIPAHLTSPGSAVGTVAYMSPEQARGDALDARTDLFSFGAVLYQLATGKMPFDGPTSAVIFNKILEKESQLPSTLNPELPPKLDEIVGKALEKDRDLRYQTAADMRTDLKRLKRDSDSGRAAAQRTATSSAVEHPSRTHDSGPTIVQKAGRTLRMWWLGAFVALLLAGSALAVWFWRTSGNHAGINSLAVLPFTYDRSDASHEFLADGITEDVINNLVQIPGLRVMARTTVFRYKGQDIDPQQIGQKLKVDAILTGRLTHHNEEMTIQADLVRVFDGAQIWGHQFTRPEQQAHDLQSDITREITQMLRARITGDEIQHITASKTQDPEAYELYLRARFHLAKRTRQDIAEGIAYLQQAVQRDPSYAEAQAQLALACSISTGYGVMNFAEAQPKAKAAAMKALQLDPRLGEAHIAMGLVKAAEFDWSGADQEYKRGLELTPNDATAHYAYANISLLAQGRYDEAIAEFRKALELDPFSGIINANYAAALSAAGRAEAAIEQIRKALDIDPNFEVALDRGSEIYAAAGQYDDAWKLVARRFPQAAALYSGGGHDAFYSAYVQARAGADPADLAIAYAGAGNKDAAFTALGKTLERDPVDVGLLRTPQLNSLRSDPRYAEMLKRAKLNP